MSRGRDLYEPGRGGFSDFYDPEAFGRFSEAIARFMGTGRFLVGQTIVVISWIALNLVLVGVWRWDPYPFILLNLAFSTQAAYAAPLILLAQNRQDDRDRGQAEADRELNARTQADTEFLARELSAVRLTLEDVVTAAELRDAVDRVGMALDDLTARLDAIIDPDATGVNDGPAGPGDDSPGSDGPDREPPAPDTNTPDVHDQP